MTLNDIMALSRYFTEFSSFRGALRRSPTCTISTFAISSPDEFLIVSSTGQYKLAAYFLLTVSLLVRIMVYRTHRCGAELCFDHSALMTKFNLAH